MNTGNKPAPPRCTLANIMAEPMDKDAIKRAGWVEHGILVVSIDDPALSPFDREFVRAIGNKRYGRRT